METTPCECASNLTSNKAKSLEHAPAVDGSELCEDCLAEGCQPHTGKCRAVTVADVRHY